MMIPDELNQTIDHSTNDDSMNWIYNGHHHQWWCSWSRRRINDFFLKNDQSHIEYHIVWWSIDQSIMNNKFSYTGQVLKCGMNNKMPIGGHVTFISFVCMWSNDPMIIMMEIKRKRKRFKNWHKYKNDDNINISISTIPLYIH